MTAQDPIVIVGAARTPMGGMQGDFASLAAPQLGAVAIRAALARAGVAADQVEEVIMGCVLSAGIGQAPARQASRGAGLPDSTGCTTINKMCGSGMKAAMFAHDLLLAGSNKVMVAGGMESMTNAPYLLDKARAGFRLGHGRVLDHMFLDGLEDAYDKGRLMGSFAEDTAQSYGFTREAQDEFALASLSRALKASTDGSFAGEIAPVALKSRQGETLISVDEQPAKARPEKIPTLKPAFGDGGEFLLDFRWRGGVGADASLGSRQARPGPARHHSRPRQFCPPAGAVHHRSGRRHPQCVGQGGLDHRSGRPVGDQRGLRRGGDDRHARSRPAA